MSARKKICLWSFGALGAVLVILLMTPLYLNSPAIRSKIQSAASSALGGTVAYQKLDLSLLPLPHVTIIAPSLSIPGALDGTLRSLSIYPQLFPLLRGKVLVSEVRLQDPDLRITLTGSSAQAGTMSLSDVRSKIRGALHYVNAIAPGLVVRIDRGVVVLFSQERRVLSLRNIDAQWTALREGMAMKARATSDLWGAVALSGNVIADDDTVVLRDLSGTLGQSTVSGLSARVDWKEPARLEILSGTAVFSLHELYQWLLSYGHLPASVKDLKNLQGTVTFASLSAGGQLLRPLDWHWKITGGAENIKADSDIFPAQLALSGQFIAEQDSLTMTNVKASLGKTSVAGVAARLDWKDRPKFRISSGAAVISLGELFAWRERYKELAGAFGKVTALDGTIRLSAMSLGGLFSEPRSWRTSLTGEVNKVVLAAPRLPGPVALKTGSFGLAPNKLSFTKVLAAVRDSSFTLSGSLTGFPGDISTADLTGSGTIGPEIVQWAYTTFALPRDYLVNAPVSFADARLLWQKDGGTSFAGKLDIARGPALSLDLHREPGKLVIRKGTVKDSQSDANISLTWHEKALDLSFNGTLAPSTLNSLFASQTFGSGKLAGRFDAAIPIDRPLESTANGSIEGDDIIVPWGLSQPLKINTIRLQADGHLLTVAPSSCIWKGSQYDISGTVRPSPEGFIVDGDLSTDRIDVDELQRIFAKPDKKNGEDGEGTAGMRALTVRGLLRVKAQDLVFGKYTATPARAEVSFGPGRANITFTRAKICAISTPGTIDLSAGGIAFDFLPAAVGQQLEQSIACLSGADVNMSGTYDLNSEVRSQGKSGALMSSLEGKVDFIARNGTIYRYPLLAKIFSILSVTEILRGKVPKLGGDGFPYKSFIVKGKIHQGVFTIDHAFIDGSSIDLIASGEVDLAGKKIDLVVLVAPFSTVNWIIRHIPLVGKIMSGNLISIPVRVSGDLADPEVTFLSPTAVGSRLVELLKNILKIPVEIVSPLLPQEPEK